MVDINININILIFCWNEIEIQKVLIIPNQLVFYQDNETKIKIKLN